MKGSLSVSKIDIMTILATQKNKISTPVSKILFGKKALKSGFSSFGQPNTENGNKAELNQVSKTSGSYVKVISSFDLLNLIIAFYKASSIFLAIIHLFSLSIISSFGKET